MDITMSIEYFRAAKKIRKADMARALDMDASHYSKLEQRGDKLTIEQLRKIANALEISVVELLTGKPVQDSERVKELEKRVSELEGRVKDKEQIIKGSEYVINEILDNVEGYINDLIYALAEKHKVGKKVVYYESGKEVSMTFQEYEESYQFEKEPFSTLHILAQSEEQHFFNLLLETDEHDFLGFFFRRGLIDDTNLLSLYDGYIESMINSIEKRRTRKSPKA